MADRSLRQAPGEDDSSPLLQFVCPKSVGSMPSVPGGNFCALCQKTVWDLSELTVHEAARVVRDGTSELCVSYQYRTRDALVFRGQRQGRVVVALATFIAACNTSPAEVSANSSHTQAKQVSTATPLASSEASEPAREASGDRASADAGDDECASGTGGTGNAPTTKAPVLPHHELRQIRGGMRRPPKFDPNDPMSGTL
jgi:hypothetical protein